MSHQSFPPDGLRCTVPTHPASAAWAFWPACTCGQPTWRYPPSQPCSWCAQCPPARLWSCSAVPSARPRTWQTSGRTVPPSAVPPPCPRRYARIRNQAPCRGRWRRPAPFGSPGARPPPPAGWSPSSWRRTPSHSGTQSGLTAWSRPASPAPKSRPGYSG